MNYLASGINVVSVNPGALVVTSNIVCAGTITAASFVGNVGNASLPATIAADLVGNVTGNTLAAGGGAFFANSTGASARELRSSGNVLGATATVTGNATAAYFVGNGALLTGIAAVSNTTLPNTIAADIAGNLAGTKATLSGNATAAYFKGNGWLLTGIANALPKTITADLVGNANAWTVRTWALSVGYDNLISNVGGTFTQGLFNTGGPIFSEGFVSGNTDFTDYSWSSTDGILRTKAVELTGNATAVRFKGNTGTFSGNVSALNFIGNGKLLTDVVSWDPALPGTLAADITGNIAGATVSMVGNLYGTSVDVTQGVYANSFEGNTALFNELDVNGNVSVFPGSYFIGNGALLTGITVGGHANTISADIVGNLVGDSATLSGNATARHFVGNGALLTSLPPPGNIATDFRFFGNVWVPTSDVVANVLQSYSTIYCGNVLTMGFRLQRNLLTLYGSPNPVGIFQFSLGVDPGQLRYQANSTTSRHMFWCGTSQVASIGMQSTAPAFRLYPPNPAVDATTLITNDGVNTWFNSTAPGDPNGPGKVSSRPLNFQNETGDAEFGADVTVLGNVFAGPGTGMSTADAVMYVSAAASTARSINAAGTVNASGADYAEYMTKAPGVADVAKGAIVGVDANGMLTDRFADAVTFAIKSTDPALVGGDAWGSDAALDLAPPGADAGVAEVEMWKMVASAARARVDRVAFAGRVPCNVYGATPGQHIVPHDPGDGSIAGRAVSATAPTLEALYDRLNSVGRVVSVLPDGRALVVVCIP